MKAILIDPQERSLETIEVIGDETASLIELRKLVDDDLDFCYFMPGEMVAVGDHSALDPSLPPFLIGEHKLYGRGVVLGHTRDGETRETHFTVETIWPYITWS